MRIATSKMGTIAGYALIAATVGMILRAIQERVGFIGRIIVGLLGVGWTVATYLVVPVLVTRDVGPIDAVKESAGWLKKTWGENVIRPAKARKDSIQGPCNWPLRKSKTRGRALRSAPEPAPRGRT